MTSTFILKQFDYSLSISVRDSLPLNLLRFLLVKINHTASLLLVRKTLNLWDQSKF